MRSSTALDSKFESKFDALRVEFSALHSESDALRSELRANQQELMAALQNAILGGDMGTQPEISTIASLLHILVAGDQQPHDHPR